MELRRGAEAIKASAEAAKGRGGNFRPFVPSIYWKDTDEHRSKYILILNRIDEIPVVNTISFIPVPDSPVGEMVIARTDPYIGESSDPLEKDWDGQVQESNIMVAVELEAMVEDVNGRRRPRGFEVKTVEFSRRVRDDAGELTDETEDVIAPAIGVIVQRPTNFGNVLTAYDESESEINRTPIKVSRQSTQPVTFQIQGYPDQKVDLTNLLEYVDGIGYLREEMDDLIETISELDPFDAANAIGTLMLNKRIKELANNDRYQSIYDGVTESLDRFGNNKKKENKSKPKATRPSQRRSEKTDDEPVERKESTAKKDPLADLKARAAAKKAK